MGLFGKCLIREFEEKEPGYYFQVFLTRPKENKVPVNPTRMWETEKDALKDLSYSIPKLIERDSKDYDSLIIKDASILNKYIYIAKIEKPHRIDIGVAKVEEIEYDTLQKYLNKNNILFRVKLQNSVLNASRNRVINLSILDLKDSLKNTEITKKCVKYNFKENGILYDRFIGGYEDSLHLASYDAYLGIPNPRKNVKELEKFYGELHDAVNSANSDILRMGYKLELLGAWDRGSIILESLSSILGESNIIYEEPTNLKIDGKPADEEGEDDDNTDYSVAIEPEDDVPAEETPAEDNNPEEAESADDKTEDTPAEEEDEHADDDTAPNDYRINTDDQGDEQDNTETDNDDVTQTDEEQPADDTEETPEDTPAEEEDEHADDDTAPNDYRINTDDQGDEQDNTETDNDNTDEAPAENDDVPPEDQSQEEDEIKTQEKEIFANLAPEQRRIQDEELKENYITLYNTIGDLINRVDQINLNNEIREPVTFVRGQLNDLKDFVFKYLSEVYSTKTYIENNINYQQYLVIMNNINQLLIKLDIKSTDID